jgi:hypothetical protein
MQQQVNVDVSKFDDIICPKCKSKYWEQVFVTKLVSAIMSPNGKETLVNIPTLVCRDCCTEINSVINGDKSNANLSL